MNQRAARKFGLFILVLFMSSCSNLDFIASGRTPFKIAVGKNADQKIEIESTADFYFWGQSPGNSNIDLEDQSNKYGLDLPSSVTVEQSTSWKSVLYTIVTLGLYCPVDYKISMLTVKEPK